MTPSDFMHQALPLADRAEVDTGRYCYVDMYVDDFDDFVPTWVFTTEDGLVVSAEDGATQDDADGLAWKLEGWYVEQYGPDIRCCPHDDFPEGRWWLDDDPETMYPDRESALLAAVRAELERKEDDDNDD